MQISIDQIHLSLEENAENQIKVYVFLVFVCLS